MQQGESGIKKGYHGLVGSEEQTISGQQIQIHHEREAVHRDGSVLDRRDHLVHVRKLRPLQIPEPSILPDGHMQLYPRIVDIYAVRG